MDLPAVFCVCHSGEATGRKALLGSSRWPSTHPGGENFYVQNRLGELQRGRGAVEGSQIRARPEGEPG